MPFCRKGRALPCEPWRSSWLRPRRLSSPSEPGTSLNVSYRTVFFEGLNNRVTDRVKQDVFLPLKRTFSLFSAAKKHIFHDMTKEKARFRGGKTLKRIGKPIIREASHVKNALSGAPIRSSRQYNKVCAYMRARESDYSSPFSILAFRAASASMSPRVVLAVWF